MQEAERLQDQWRIRVGDWRAVQVIDDAKLHRYHVRCTPV
jgi:hypothetical protein